MSFYLLKKALPFLQRPQKQSSKKSTPPLALLFISKKARLFTLCQLDRVAIHPCPRFPFYPCQLDRYAIHPLPLSGLRRRRRPRVKTARQSLPSAFALGRGRREQDYFFPTLPCLARSLLRRERSPYLMANAPPPLGLTGYVKHQRFGFCF